MFTPIKNFITYIQKNASNNSIFGGNNITEEESNKMEVENAIIETEFEPSNEKEDSKEIITLEEINKEGKQNSNETTCESKKTETNLTTLTTSENTVIETTTTTITTTTTSTVSTENACEYEDIEAQIGSSIMLKKPVIVTATNGSEILEVKKTSNANCGVVISHDFNRNQSVVTPIDDELEDFRHDPTEVLVSTSPYTNRQPVNELCSLESCDEAEEGDKTLMHNELLSEDEENDIEKEEEPKIVDETDLEEEKDTETEAEDEQKDLMELEDDEEEGEDQFLDIDNYKRTNVIDLEVVDLNASTTSIDTINTVDDPLAIACEEQEAFTSDKVAALEELHLLNNAHASHDEDTRTTTEDDLQWLRTDLDDPQPCCSKVLLKVNSSDVTPEKEERNGEGSDSGLGSETSALHTTAASITDTSQLNATTTTPAQTPTLLSKTVDTECEKFLNSNNILLLHPKSPTSKPYRSNLKRRLEVEDVEDGLASLTSATTSLASDRSCLNGSIQKKPKRSINFDNVQVYYFPRQQGFSCVPSAGGCTLGMAARHVAFKTLSLAEHAAELRRAHRMQLQEINPRGSSSDDSEESEEDYLSEGSGSDLDGESNGFLQPVSPKQRRALLKAAGIRKIDPSEKAECRNIRNSREVCGCSCRDFCDPETCACSQSGIKCQVDRDMFPCGCSRDACGNTIGRVEFNPARVRTHFIHTLMRLEMENRQQQNPYSSVVGSPSTMQPTTPISYYQSHLQPQSNYSSGYASPAYNTAPELHQQTATTSYYHTPPPSTANGLYGQQNSLEITHTGSGINNNTTTQYGLDSLESGLFGATSTAVPSYGELMTPTSYHYGNVQTQASQYYHNGSSSYIHSNNTATTSLNTPHAYSSCSVPSIPPYGTATTTDATGVYHSVTSLTNLETTTAPSCNVNNGPATLDNDVGASFISLSTPLASSLRLTQINDLLQHNRNASTALVAVTQNNEAINLNSSTNTNRNIKSNYDAHETGTDNTQQQTGSSLTSIAASPAPSSINTPPIEDDHKSCMIYDQLETPLKPAPVMQEFDESKATNNVANSIALTGVEEALQDKSEETSLITTELLPKTTLCNDENNTASKPGSTAIEVAAGK